MAAMKTFSVQSGSNGNCIYVEAGETRLLFDAGISGRRARERMESRGRNIREVDALFISHEHGDHIKAAGVYQRTFGMPIYITERTMAANRWKLGRLDDVRHFLAGDSVRVGDAVVHTFSAPHDAADTVVFVVEHDNRRLGIFTDLGHPTPALTELLASVDAAYLESNYDPEMLDSGPYPELLKDRIRGKGGHISNHEAAEELKKAIQRRHQWIALAHLSAENNTPEHALEAHHVRCGRLTPVDVCSRYEVSIEREV